ncbi:hypothetical protein HAX54_028173 [Datura stramonium]|uniref:Uncharacterized protein n=1 Tax=Datura stramonium TaxID=4076 RepID=A0ABS8V5W8_DATST|nr:hypothetical protein [Datura stramonium]
MARDIAILPEIWTEEMSTLATLVGITIGSGKNHCLGLYSLMLAGFRSQTCIFKWNIFYKATNNSSGAELHQHQSLPRITNRDQDVSVAFVAMRPTRMSSLLMEIFVSNSARALDLVSEDFVARSFFLAIIWYTMQKSK